MSRADERARSAVALKLAGATYEEISDALGLTDTKDALRLVEKGLAGQVDPETRESARQQATMRYERLLRAVWVQATDIRHPQQLQHLRAAMDLTDRLVRLNGLEAPKQVVVRTPTMEELQEWVSQVTSVNQPKVIEYDVLGANVIEAPAQGESA